MFDRGIGDGFVEALKRWDHWGEITSDRDLFVGIRKDSINIYYLGCSLFKITHKKELTFETHYKYLIRPTVNNTYVLWQGDRPDVQYPWNDILIDKFDLDSLKKSSRWYADLEKAGLQRILKSNKNVVDVEIALSPNSGAEPDGEDQPSEGRRVADRIDFAAIQRRKDGPPCIVFFEAKRFENGELKARKGEPRVFGQIRKYEKFIGDNGAALKTSYGKVCKDLVKLIPPDRYDPVVKEIADNPEQLTVDPYVRLVVFDFDEDQRVGKIWGKHRKKLSDHLGNRLLLKGSPSEFKSGISK
jgi:hypothetical protein